MTDLQGFAREWATILEGIETHLQGWGFEDPRLAEALGHVAPARELLEEFASDDEGDQ